MSLINDALKKARQAQDNAPARESAPQLRPPEADHPRRSGPSLVLPATIIGALLAGGALVWFGLGARHAEARLSGNPPPPVPAPAVVSSPPPAASSTGALPIPAPAVPMPAPVMAGRSALAGTNPLPTMPTPALPKLNGIFFNPDRPTAVVNNKLVSAGSRVGEFSVVAITRQSVTLVSGGQTNVLSLSD